MENAPIQADQTKQPEAFITPPQFCRLYGFKLHSVRRAIKLGLIKTYKPFGSRQYIRPSEVLSYINSCSNGGAQ